MTQDHKPPVFPRDQWAWRELLRAALLEFDSESLPQRIQEARQAISTRVEELRDEPAMQEEKTALQDGLNSLRALARITEDRKSREPRQP
jgi:hypothetical protein